MIFLLSRDARRMGILTLALLGILAQAGLAQAGGWRHGSRGRNQTDPHRGQHDYIRNGLGPDSLPYTRHGLRGWGHKYPTYPLFHAPIPPGPGDCLYETGPFPWQRG
jgi:hypothetical protein